MALNSEEPLLRAIGGAGGSGASADLCRLAGRAGGRPAEYVRLRCEILRPETESDAKKQLQRQAKGLAAPLDARWLRRWEAQDRLYRIGRRCKGAATPPALRVLWQEAAKAAPDVEEWNQIWVPGAGLHREITLETVRECQRDRDEYLENEDIADAFLRMFKQIDFLGSDSSGGVFGFWRYVKGVTMADAPIVYLNDSAEFLLGGATLQDFFAVPNLGTLAGRRKCLE